MKEKIKEEILEEWKRQHCAPDLLDLTISKTAKAKDEQFRKAIETCLNKYAGLTPEVNEFVKDLMQEIFGSEVK